MLCLTDLGSDQLIKGQTLKKTLVPAAWASFWPLSVLHVKNIWACLIKKEGRVGIRSNPNTLNYGSII